MTERKLTPAQIDQLFEFCRKHYVTQYDLQIELVDHLASAIESQWEKNSDMSFNEALNNTFGKFGIYGFSKTKEQKAKALEQKYNRLLFKYFTDFYRWPKILTTLSVSILIFMLFRITKNVSAVTFVISLTIIATIIVYHFYLFDKYFSINTTSNKKFMLIDCLKNRQLMIAVFYQIPWILSQIISRSSIKYSGHPEVEFLLAFFLSGFSILFYLYFFIIPQKIKEHFTQQFPQFIKA